MGSKSHNDRFVAAIILWNTVYLERAIAALRKQGIAIEDESLTHLSPIGWEHFNHRKAPQEHLQALTTFAAENSGTGISPVSKS